MNSFGQSNVRILSAEQSRRLLDVCRQVAATGSPRTVLGRLVASIGEILGVKAAMVAKIEDRWELLAESHPAPPLPTRGVGAAKMFERCNAAREAGVQAWSHDQHDWTLAGLAGGARTPVVLVLEDDWTLSGPSVLEFARNLPSFELPSAPASATDVSVATHRLTRTLARVTGVHEVCNAVLRHVVRVVPSRFASFAVPGEGDQLAIVATHGYPVELVEGLRIPPGNGIIGFVYQNRAPLCVPDINVFTGRQRRRPRYRTDSFVALPISAGSSVLGVLCAADRLDDGTFTHADVRRLRAMTAPVALALARERAEQQAEAFAHAAVIDPVSGLFNRRYFHNRLEEELQRAQRHKTPVALLMIDIDNFKSINDRFGHMAGDTVIKGVAEILRRSLRKFDLCSRFGGEEFAIVMPGSGMENAANIAERIRQRIEGYEAEEGELKDLRVTVSIGLSVTHDIPARDLIGRADQALYAAKRSGKNRVIEWSQSVTNQDHA